jgi:hypothetical protein
MFPKGGSNPKFIYNLLMLLVNTLLFINDVMEPMGTKWIEKIYVIIQLIILYL